MSSTKYNNVNDLLDLIQQRVGCEYLSDLKFEPANTLALTEFNRMDKSFFAPDQVTEAWEYLTKD